MPNLTPPFPAQKSSETPRIFQNNSYIQISGHPKGFNSGNIIIKGRLLAKAPRAPKIIAVNEYLHIFRIIILIKWPMWPPDRNSGTNCYAIQFASVGLSSSRSSKTGDTFHAMFPHNFAQAGWLSGCCLAHIRM